MINFNNNNISEVFYGSDAIVSGFVGSHLIFPTSTPPVPPIEDNEYLNFKAIENTKLTIRNCNNVDIKYSYDKITWTQWDYSDVNLPSGTTIYLKGYNPNGFSGYYIDSGGTINYNRLMSVYDGCDGKFEAHGNILSLIYDDNFIGKYEILGDYCFCNTFDTTYMVTPPVLVATSLTNWCYYELFIKNIYLEEAPQLPALELKEGCYSHLFYGCLSLEKAPDLFAPELAINCYHQMFDMSWKAYAHIEPKLNYVKMMATDISAYNALTQWLYDNQNIEGTLILNKDVDWSSTTSSSQPPSNWTIEYADS